MLEAEGKLDLREGSLDGTSFPRTGKARLFGASAPKGGNKVGRSVKGNGSTLMVVSEAQGLPIAFLLDAANTHESQLARDVLAFVSVPRQGRGRPKTRILSLAMDRAFDAISLRRDLRKRGMKTSIPERKRRGRRRQRGPKPKLYDVSKRRYKIERINAWMDNFRGLVVRYERKASRYLAYCTLAAILFCLKRLV